MDGVAGIARKISEVEVAGIPLGEAALGGGSALVLAEVTDAMLLPRLLAVPVFAVKGAEAFVMSRYGHKVVGAGGARVATLFLAYDAVRSLIPMEDWIRNAIAKATGGILSPGSPLRYDAASEAAKVAAEAESTYKEIFGGRS